MRKPIDIASVYDCPQAAAVFRRSETQVVVSLGGRALILCPEGWGEGEGIAPFGDANEQLLQSWISAVPESEAVESFGVLLAWSCRRVHPKVTRYVFSTEAEGQVPHTTRPLYNPENINGHPFDRNLIRETLQTFVEFDCPSDQRLELRQISTGRQFALAIEGYGMTALVAALMPCEERGNDPMPGMWIKRTASEERIRG